MKKQFFRNYLYKFVFNFFKLIMPILVLPFIYRQIPIGEMGQINYVISIVTIFYLIADFGSYTYGIREISLVRENEKETAKKFLEINVLRIMIASSVFVLYLIYILKINDEYTLFFIIGSLNIISIFFSVEWFFEAKERFDFIAYRTIIIRLLNFLALFIFVRGANAGENYMIVTFLFILLGNLVSFFYVFKFIKIKWQSLSLKEHIKPMFYLFIMSNINFMYFQADRIFLGKNKMNEELASYQLAEKLILIIATFAVLNLINVLLPSMSNLIKENYEKYVAYLKNMNLVLFVFLLPSTIGLAAISKELMYIVGGESYIPYYKIFQVFSIYLFLFYLLELLKNNIILVNRREGFFFKISIFIFVLNLIIKIFLPNLNNVFVYLGLTLGFLGVLIVILSIYSIKVLKINYFERIKVRYILYSIPLVLIFLIQIQNIYFSLLAKIAVAILIYGVIFLIFEKRLLFDSLKLIRGK